MDLIGIIDECVPAHLRQQMTAIVQVESGRNKYAIGVVGGRLERQPKTKEEAVATARHLDANRWNFSLGLAQINRYNLQRFGLNYETAFEVCKNLQAGATIFGECLSKAKKTIPENAKAEQAAFSCYYSGNFKRGLVIDDSMGTSYVQRITAAAGNEAAPTRVIPGRPSPIRRPEKEVVKETPTAPAHWDIFHDYSPPKNKNPEQSNPTNKERKETI